MPGFIFDILDVPKISAPRFSREMRGREPDQQTRVPEVKRILAARILYVEKSSKLLTKEPERCFMEPEANEVLLIDCLVAEIPCYMED